MSPRGLDYWKLSANMHHLGYGIWRSSVSIRADLDVCYTYSANFGNVVKNFLCQEDYGMRPLKETVEHYNVFKRFSDGEVNYHEVTIFEARFAFVQLYFSWVYMKTEPLQYCLEKIHQISFGKQMSKSNFVKIVDWAFRRLESGCNNKGMVFIVVLLGKLLCHKPDYLHLGDKTKTIEDALMAMILQESDEIPPCAARYLVEIAPLLINACSCPSTLALLTYFCTTIGTADLSHIKSKMKSIPQNEETYNHLLSIAGTLLPEVSQCTKEMIARAFAEEAPSLKSLLKCGKTLHSTYESSPDMANVYVRTFKERCENPKEPAEVCNTSVLERWKEIPSDLKKLIEASFMQVIVKAIELKPIHDKTKLDFLKRLVLSYVFSQSVPVSQVVEAMATSKCEQLLDLTVQMFDAEKFCPIWAKFDGEMQETLCLRCCEGMHSLLDKQAGTHTITNTLIVLKRVCETRVVKGNKLLKKKIRDEVMRHLREQSKLSSFLDAFKLASERSDVPKKLYIQGLCAAFHDSAEQPHEKLREIWMHVSRMDPNDADRVPHLKRYLYKSLPWCFFSILFHLANIMVKSCASISISAAGVVRLVM